MNHPKKFLAIFKRKIMADKNHNRKKHIPLVGNILENYNFFIGKLSPQEQFIVKALNGKLIDTDYNTLQQHDLKQLMLNELK